jgi:UDP-N-acetylmuramate: L-alanyl-gamma-D-glutamyl-meso-diaminopimelate ligase
MTFPFSPEIKKYFDSSAESRIEYIRKLEKGSHIHISGVCGTGTGAVLSLLKQLGFYVTGSDKAFYPPMGEVVKATADIVYEEFSESNLYNKPALVVIGNALSRGNPEVEYVIKEGLPFCSMPEVFSALLIGTREECPTSVVVSGTHGKTTTSSLIASVLADAGMSPGYFIGGVLTGNVLKGSVRSFSRELPVSQRTVVLEGDEYDSAFFAKYSKFHCYRPDVAVVTNIEFDHADIFEDLDAIKNEFRGFIKRVPKSGAVIVCADSLDAHALVKEVLASSPAAPAIISYGSIEGATVQLVDRKNWVYQQIPEIRQGQILTYRYKGEQIEVKTKLSGLHNALNIGAALSVCFFIGLKKEVVLKGIHAYHPVKRRQQIIVEKNGVVLIEDFAHHPTEVKATLEGIREAYPGKRLVAVFEPRSNTARRAFFRDEYKAALSLADIVVIKEVESSLSTYSGVAFSTALFEVSELAGLLDQTGKTVFYHNKIELLVKYVSSICLEDDVIVVMSNGDFGDIITFLKNYIVTK